MQFRVLGRVELIAGDRKIALPKPRGRAVLAYLVLSANRLVTTDSLIDALWGDAPPATARNQIQVDISAIRRTLRQAGLSDPIKTTSFGYQISLHEDESDLASFESLRHTARRLSEQEGVAAAELLRKALDLWQGEPLGDVTGAFVDAARTALAEQHLSAVEDWADLALKLLRHRDVVRELGPFVRQWPSRESIARRLAIALYGDGQGSEALAVLRALRKALAEELGIDMSPALAELEVSMLRGTTEVAGATSAAPAPRPVARPSVNALPPSVPAFTGRHSELAELETLMSGGPALAAVTGSGGIGKTALVLHWAHQAAQRFPDGLLYVDLCGFAHRPPVPPIEALARLLYQLGVAPAQIPVREEFAVDLYRSQLAGKRALVVLDNARDSAQVRSLLPGAPGCGTVVTSRVELTGLVARDGAVPIQLDVLPPAQSRQLLAELLGSHDAADAAELDELAGLCACVPLALRIAAAHLRGQKQWRIKDYVAQIGSEERLRAWQLDGDDNAAMGATLRLSYDVLEVAVQRLFRLLSLVPGPDVTAEAAAALAGLPVDQANLLLAKLASAHLVEERGAARFGFHDLLRMFAASQAEAEEDQRELAAARQRLYAYYLSAVDAAARRLYPQVLRLPFSVPSPVLIADSDAEAVAWLDAERVNLVAAVAHGCEHGPRRQAWQLGDALRGYFFLRMFTVDWQIVACAAAQAARRENEAPAQAAALLSLADLHWRQGEYEEAEAAYTEAIGHAANGSWPAGQATALGNLGGLRRMQGRLPESANMIEQSLALNVAIGRIEGQLVNVGNLGIIYGELGEWAKSETYLDRTNELCQRTGARTAQAVALSNLVETAMRLGRLDLAQQRLIQALALHHELGDKAGEAATLRSEALLRQEQGDHVAALRIAQSAVALAEESADHRVLAHCLQATAAILHATGDYSAALGPAERSVELANGAGHRYIETRALVGLARIHHALGSPQEALSRARQALSLAESCGYLELAGEAAREVQALAAQP